MHTHARMYTHAPEHAHIQPTTNPPTYTHTHTHPYQHAHAHSHTRARTRTPTRTRTHKHARAHANHRIECQLRCISISLVELHDDHSIT